MWIVSIGVNQDLMKYDTKVFLQLANSGSETELHAEGPEFNTCEDHIPCCRISYNMKICVKPEVKISVPEFNKISQII